jgi:hypothetical protein
VATHPRFGGAAFERGALAMAAARAHVEGMKAESLIGRRGTARAEGEVTARADRGATLDDPALVAAERLARAMDGWYVDPLLGLFVPWAGDVIGAGLGLYPVLLAWRRGADKALLARMLLNLSVDLVGGAVPVVGDLWDFFFRAHSRNLALLRSRTGAAGLAPRSRTRDALVIAGAGLVFLGALALPIVLLVLAVRALAS